MMKTIITLITFILSTTLYAATCTSTSRTNYTVNQVLTSTALNADFNQLVTKANAMDAGCLTDGTLESSALDTSFNALKNGLHQGCKMNYVDTNTVSIGYCILSVSGNFVKTTANTSVTWGCSSCSSEVVSTIYYVYAKTSSTGSTLNLLISTTAPNGDGLDGTGNKVLGKFYNNSSSNINANSLEVWSVSQFIQNQSVSFITSYGGASLSTPCQSAPCLTSSLSPYVDQVNRSAQGIYNLVLNRNLYGLQCTGHASLSATQGSFFLIANSASSPTSSIEFATASNNSAAIYADTLGTVMCQGYLQ